MTVFKRITGAALALVLCLAANTAPAGNGALLGVQIDFPNIEFLSLAGQGATYDGTTLTITSTPVLLTFTSGGADEFIVGGSLTLTADIDSSGNFTGGSFTVDAVQVTDSATTTTYTGPLLTGTVTDYGIIDVGPVGGTDLADFELNVTGGSLQGLFDAVGTTAGAQISLEGSDFSGSFASAWSATRAKGDIGPIPGGEPPPPPLSYGYWTQHPEAWPVSSLTICGVSLDQTALLSILDTKPKGDKTIIMSKQLIAAMLNVANGNSCSSLDDAETWLCDHGGIGAGIKNWDGGEALKDDLDAFNNGGSCLLP